jgi:hypothetical protein
MIAFAACIFYDSLFFMSYSMLLADVAVPVCRAGQLAG